MSLHSLTQRPLISRLTNAKPSAIYRLRPHLPANIPQGPSPPAQLGIEIAPLPQLEALQAQISLEGKGKEVAQRVEVGKVAEKVVKNVSSTLTDPHKGTASNEAALQLPAFLRRRRQAHVCVSRITPQRHTHFAGRRPLYPSPSSSTGTTTLPAKSKTTRARPSSTGRISVGDEAQKRTVNDIVYTCRRDDRQSAIMQANVTKAFTRLVQSTLRAHTLGYSRE